MAKSWSLSWSQAKPASFPNDPGSEQAYHRLLCILEYQNGSLICGSEWQHSLGQAARNTEDPGTQTLEKLTFSANLHTRHFIAVIQSRGIWFLPACVVYCCQPVHRILNRSTSISLIGSLTSPAQRVATLGLLQWSQTFCVYPIPVSSLS